jgi:hypothetical protein
MIPELTQLIMKKRRHLCKQMKKYYAKNGKILSRTERWLLMLFIAKLAVEPKSNLGAVVFNAILFVAKLKVLTH